MKTQVLESGLHTDDQKSGGPFTVRIKIHSEAFKRDVR